MASGALDGLTSLRSVDIWSASSEIEVFFS